MKRKIRLQCPLCGFGRLIDSSESTKSELRAEKDIDQSWTPDYYQKCPGCKKQIGIKKVC